MMSRFFLSKCALSLIAGTCLLPLVTQAAPIKYSQTEYQANNPMAINGMVTSPNYLATQAGLDVLKKGGSAIDAAIATASTMAVVYPQMTTIGGDNFWLIYDSKNQKILGLNASGRSGEKANIDFYRNQGFDKIPSRGYLAANTVPGIVSGWNEAYQYSKKHMVSRTNWADDLAQAIHYAANGFPVSTSLHYWTQVNINPNDTEFRALQRFEGFKQSYLKADGSAYQVGEILKQPKLANTLKLISEKGQPNFILDRLLSAS